LAKPPDGAASPPLGDRDVNLKNYFYDTNGKYGKKKVKFLSGNRVTGVDSETLTPGQAGAVYQGQISGAVAHEGSQPLVL
jgi:hypothetical protein